MITPHWRLAGVGIVVAAAFFASATPARAGYSIISSTFDDVVGRESAGMETGLFGDRAFRDVDPQTIAIQPVAGAYGGSGTLSGVGASWHTTRFAPWDFGAAATMLDVEFRTWTFALSTGYRAWSHGRSLVLLEGALGYQRMANRPGDYTAIRLDAPGNPAGDLVLMDSFDFFHGLVQATYTTQVSFFHPVVYVAFVGTRYRFDAAKWDGALPVSRGARRHETGDATTATLGIGASVDIHRANIFGGVRAVQDAAVFQLGLGLVF